LPHYLTLLLEGQGYVLAMLAIYVQGRWVLPGMRPRGQAYWNGMVEAMRLYALVAIVLAIAAMYEAWELIYLAPLLKCERAKFFERRHLMMTKTLSPGRRHGQARDRECAGGGMGTWEGVHVRGGAWKPR
jgi:hypothetical protein